MQADVPTAPTPCPLAPSRPAPKNARACTPIKALSLSRFQIICFWGEGVNQVGRVNLPRSGRRSERHVARPNFTSGHWLGTCYINGDEDVGALAFAAGQARDCPHYSGGQSSKYETAASRKLTSHGYWK